MSFQPKCNFITPHFMMRSSWPLWSLVKSVYDNLMGLCIGVLIFHKRVRYGKNKKRLSRSEHGIGNQSMMKLVSLHRKHILHFVASLLLAKLNLVETRLLSLFLKCNILCCWRNVTNIMYFHLSQHIIVIITINQN